jgi:hypothetical protein
MQVIALEREYKDCKWLFCTLLGLKNANLEHVIDELLSRPEPDFDGRKKLLLVLNEYLRNKMSSSAIEKLKGGEIIPVKMVRKPKDQTNLMNYDRDTWYLADKTSLQESFKEKVWLIDFPVDVVRKLSPLVKAMKLEDYLLTVWGVTAIKLKRRIGNIEGTEDSGDVVFKETTTKLDIYIPIDIENQSLFVYQLSERLIKHCNITESRFEKLVPPILTAPISKILKLLEQYDLDADFQSDAGSYLPRSFFENVPDQDQENILGTSTSIEIFSTSRLSVPGAVSSLRASIPTLDQSIASVRQAAALEDGNSSFTVFGPQASSKSRAGASSTEASDIHDDSGFVDELTGSTISSSPGVTRMNSDEGGSGDVFGVAALRSALPEANESRPRMSFENSRFTGSPSHSRSHGRYFAGPVDEGSSTRVLHDRYIGLLGEIFVSYLPYSIQYNSNL